MKKPSKGLIKEWYDKLAESGFNDTEYFDSEMEPRHVQKKDTYKHALEIQDRYIMNQDYYRYARQLNHTDLIPEADKAIWALHSEGVAYREIATELGTNYTKVCQSVKRTLVILETYRKEEEALQSELD